MDAQALAGTAREAVEFVRSRRRPLFLECRTYRFRAHSMFDPELYRTREEVEKWKKRDPITGLVKVMREQGRLSDEDLQRIEKDVIEEIEDGVRFAEQCSREPFQDMCTDACTTEVIA
jgi:pyruvate dehydrogenase E1 component alpha subunit/2-oxoisovalerate dehydrogenase E1 component